jgi:enoyl-[acyl-carrier-protein] reductase (NADH)
MTIRVKQHAKYIEESFPLFLQMTLELTKTVGVQSLAMELGKYQISVMAIARGLTESDALPTLLTSEQAVKMASRIIPSQRWMNSGEGLEGLVIFLASDSAKYSTGNIFIVDGGQTLPRPRMRSYI